MPRTAAGITPGGNASGGDPISSLIVDHSSEIADSIIDLEYQFQVISTAGEYLREPMVL